MEQFLKPQYIINGLASWLSQPQGNPIQEQTATLQVRPDHNRGQRFVATRASSFLTIIKNSIQISSLSL
jgi:hypothetical protein